jgi:hypothetical protein
VENYEYLEKKAMKKALERERRRRKRMSVSGKHVFALQEKLYKTVLRAKKKK